MNQKIYNNIFKKFGIIQIMKKNIEIRNNNDNKNNKIESNIIGKTFLKSNEYKKEIENN